MSKTLRWFLVVCGFCITAGLAVGAWNQLSKPTILAVAVGPAEFDDAEILGALGRALATSKASVRLSLTPTSGPVQALERLAKGEVQLAVIRSDGATDERVRAVAILHNDPVVIVTTAATKIENFGALKGKVVGVIGPPGANDALLATLRRHYGVSGSIKSLPPVPIDISSAVRDQTVDALLFVVPTTRGAKVGESWAAVRRSSRRNLSFVPLDDAEAIAAASPAYGASEIPAGQFGGSPALPSESVTTVQVATYLVADRSVSNDAITALTRALFEERHRVAAEAPAAILMKAASIEKDAVFPVHAGAKVYYDGEETTLFERYGDWLFYGPMLLGALGSALLALMRFVGLREDTDRSLLLSRIREVIASIKEAQSIADLDEIRSNIDAAVERLSSNAARGEVDQRTAVIALAVNYVDDVMAERREVLLREGGSNVVAVGRVSDAAA